MGRYLELARAGRRRRSLESESQDREADKVVQLGPQTLPNGQPFSPDRRCGFCDACDWAWHQPSQSWRCFDCGRAGA